MKESFKKGKWSRHWEGVEVKYNEVVCMFPVHKVRVINCT
jgi:hypothetical protein